MDKKRRSWIPQVGAGDDGLEPTDKAARDSLLTGILNASAEKVLDCLGDQKQYADITELLAQTDSNCLDTAILLTAMELFDLADFYEVTTFSEASSDFLNEHLQKKMTGFDIDALNRKIQNLISFSGKRDISAWIDTQ